VPNPGPSKGSIKVNGLGVVSYNKVGGITAAQINEEVSGIYEVFNGGEAAQPFGPSLGATNGVKFFRLKYNTTIPENNRTYRVSGLLAIPNVEDSTQLPLLSWQHGTVLLPQEAPSRLVKKDELREFASFKRSALGPPRSAETLFNVARMAGNGYILAAADYIGNGISRDAPQAYAVKEATQQTTFDMITASKAVLGELGISTGPLFLNGWSQGGLNTQWLSDKLQSENIQVERQASVSGPTDLAQTLSYWFNDYPGTPNWLTAVVPLQLGAWQKYYGMKNLMANAIRPEYLETSKQIFRKEIDWDDKEIYVEAAKNGTGLLGLPLKPEDMLQRDFITNFNNGVGAYYNRAVKNTALTIEYDEQSRFYGGGDDNIVPEFLSIEAPVEYQESLGSDLATGISVGEKADHRSAFLGSLFGSASDPSNNLLDWFNSALSV
jgi:hypothetical protein